MEWISVSRKKSSGKSSAESSEKLLAKGHSALNVNTKSNETPEAIVKSLLTSKESVTTSTYYQFLIKHISSHTEEKFRSIIAFGLGNLTSDTSRLQLVIYLCLCDSLLFDLTTESSRSIFDPVISDTDRKVYNLLQIPVLSENTKGKHSIDKSENTLFFLPHCPYRLYCNVLWANWENLNHLYILGNR